MSPETMKHTTAGLLDVLIVGGGLSGLMVAHELRHLNLSWRLLEARAVLGGRLVNDSKGHKIDLGGAWIWPFQQPNMKRLTSSLSIPTFPQPDDPMSIRIEGGAVEYIHRLCDTLPSDAIQLDTAVTSCRREKDVVRVDTFEGETLLARRVVIAIPPRLIAKKIEFDPPLSSAKVLALNASHTWMAAVTKVGLVYNNRFWDEHSSNMGFSGSPAFQVYDASTKDASVAALTFFTLANDTDDDKTLATKCAAQIQDVWSYYRKPFADKALDFIDFHIQRWPKEQYISEDDNPSRVHPHPHPVHELAQPEWDGTLLFAGSESDLTSPGVMEGAVGAALRVAKEMRDYCKASS